MIKPEYFDTDIMFVKIAWSARIRALSDLLPLAILIISSTAQVLRLLNRPTDRSIQLRRHFSISLRTAGSLAHL